MTILIEDFDGLISDTYLNYLDLDKNISLEFALGKLAAYAEMVSMITEIESIAYKDHLLRAIDEFSGLMKEQKEERQKKLMEQNGVYLL